MASGLMHDERPSNVHLDAMHWRARADAAESWTVRLPSLTEAAGQAGGPLQPLHSSISNIPGPRDGSSANLSIWLMCGPRHSNVHVDHVL